MNDIPLGFLLIGFGMLILFTCIVGELCVSICRYIRLSMQFRKRGAGKEFLLAALYRAVLLFFICGAAFVLVPIFIS